MTLITPGYLALNAEQHQMSNGYGERGYKHLDDILHVLRREDCHSVLDYGCGKASLAKYARRVCEVPFANYDPAIPEYAVEPVPVDLVVCTDVLEHVEPACIVSVLDHIASLAEKAVYLQIATRAAKRTLSNGQNAHILQRDPYWWWNILAPRFDITDLKVAPGHSIVVVAKCRGAIYP